PIFSKLQFPRVSHAAWHRNHRQLLSLWVEPHNRVAARAAYPNLSRSPVNIDRIRNVVALAWERIDLPLVALWIVTAKVAAAEAGYPHDSIVCNFEPARAMDWRLPLSDLARGGIDHSDPLAVELRVPNLAVRRDVYAVWSDSSRLAHRRDVGGLLGFEQLILFDLERSRIEPEDRVHRGVGVPADTVLIEAQRVRITAAFAALNQQKLLRPGIEASHLAA